MKFCGLIVGLGFAGTLLTCCANAAACTGSTDAWGVVSDPDGSLTVNSTATMVGDCGLSVTVAVQGKRYVQDDTPSAETSYRARFYINPNSIPLPSSGTNRKIKVHNLQSLVPSAPNVGLLQIKLTSKNGVGYGLIFAVRDTNTGPWYKVFIPLIDDHPNSVEYQLQIGDGDGVFRAWVNNDDTSNPDFVKTDLSNAAYVGVDRVRFGRVGVGSNAVGNIPFFLDDFVSTRHTFIGYAP